MTLHLTVKPGSEIDKFFYDAAGKLNAKIKAPTQDGRANAYLIKFLTRIRHRQIAIVAGFANLHERVEIDVTEDGFVRFRERISN